MRVEVTWNYKGRILKDICELVPYDATIKTFDGILLPQELSETIKKDGFVIFEDDEGIFCLKASQIRNITPIV